MDAKQTLLKPDEERAYQGMFNELDAQRKKTVARLTAQHALEGMTSSDLQMWQVRVLVRMLTVVLWEGSTLAKLDAGQTIKALRRMVYPAIEQGVRRLFAQPPYDPTKG